MSYKINTWYKRTDIDYNNPEFNSYSTHFFITEEWKEICRCSKVLRGCAKPVTFIDQRTVSKNSVLKLVECSQEEMDLLLNRTNNYEIY